MDIGYRKGAEYASFIAIVLLLTFYTRHHLVQETGSAPITAAPTLGKDYVLVSNTDIVPLQAAKQRVSILGFFSYYCTACEALEAPINQWLARQPLAIQFEQIPFTDGSFAMDQIARIHYLSHQLKSNMTRTIFKWVEEGHNLQDLDALKTKLLALGVSLADYERAVSQQAGLDAQIARGKNLQMTYRVKDTPVVIVGGHYKTSLAMVNGDLVRFFETLDFLVQTVRQGTI